MLYLLLCNSNIKIGYTSNLESRMKTYKTHNPFAELIDTINGDEHLEAIFHSILSSTFTRVEETEWFNIADTTIIPSIKEQGFGYFDNKYSNKLINPLKAKEMSYLGKKEIEEKETKARNEWLNLCDSIYFPAIEESLEYINDDIKKYSSYGCRYAYINTRHAYNILNKTEKIVSFKTMHLIFDEFFSQKGYKINPAEWDNKTYRWTDKHYISW